MLAGKSSEKRFNSLTSLTSRSKVEVRYTMNFTSTLGTIVRVVEISYQYYLLKSSVNVNILYSNAIRTQY